jgi:hypothetical protein
LATVAQLTPAIFANRIALMPLRSNSFSNSSRRFAGTGVPHIYDPLLYWSSA